MLMRMPTEGIDYTNKDYESFRTMMIERLQVLMPEYTDIRQSDAGIVILECLAQGLDILSMYQDIMGLESFLETAEQRENIIRWANMLGYYPRFATPAHFKQVFVLASPQLTDFIIPAGVQVKTESSLIEPEVFFETVEDFIIPSGNLGNEQDIEGEYLYTVEVVEGQTVADELVGTSNGTPHQQFILGYRPVIVDSIRIVINEGSGFQEWMRVDSFIESRSYSQHFIVQLNTLGESIIRFGDGFFGKIPTPFQDGIFASYRVGGGLVGNVSARKINILETNIAVVAETFNPDTAFVSGADNETDGEIKANIPMAYRTRWGALTLEDFAWVVEHNFPEDVIYAIAERDQEDIDDLHIFILLKDNAPLTDEFKRRILRLFDIEHEGRKIVGAKTIYIQSPYFIPLDLTAELIVLDRFQQSEVEDEIRRFIENYLAVGNYPFNTPVVFSQLSKEIIANIQGVKGFRFSSPAPDVIQPSVNEIFKLSSLTFVTTGGIV